MSKFIRQNSDSLPHAGGSARIYGKQITMGEPLKIENESAFRNELEASLATMTQSRLQDAETQAEQIVKEAQAQAKALVEKAKEEADALVAQAKADDQEIRERAREEGFKEGFEEGYADGRNAAEEEAVSLLESAQALVQGAYLAEQRVLKDFEPQALDLIQYVLKKILGEHFDGKPEAWLTLLEHGLDSLYLTGKVKLVLNPSLLHELKVYSSKTKNGLEAFTRIELIPDLLLNEQQMYVIGQEGCFDLSPDSQMKLLLEPINSHLSLPKPSNALEGMLSEVLMEEHALLSGTANELMMLPSEELLVQEASVIENAALDEQILENSEEVFSISIGKNSLKPENGAPHA